MHILYLSILPPYMISDNIHITITVLQFLGLAFLFSAIGYATAWAIYTKYK